MSAAFAAAGLGQILDFVPNHMGVGGADNPLWLDILEWGPESDHAGWFDIDWDSDNRYLRDKLLVPFLGDQYGAELKSGKLKIKFDPDEGSLAVWAYDTHKLPLCPLHYQIVLGQEDTELDRLGDLFADLRQWRPEVSERTLALKASLATLVRDRPEAQAVLEQSIGALNDDWRARADQRHRFLAPGDIVPVLTTSTTAASSTSTISPACAWRFRPCSATFTR